jgi:hypothetical protein
VREAATERPGALNRTIAYAAAVAPRRWRQAGVSGRKPSAQTVHPTKGFLLSSFRTPSHRKPSQFTRKLTGSVVAVAAFASGATATALAGSAAPSVASHAAAVPASPVGGASQPAYASPASTASPASLASPPSVSRHSLVLTAYSRADYARSVARRMLPRFHWSVRKQFRYLNWLWNRESGWNKYARNPYSGAYGIPQALPGSKMASAGPNWRWNAWTQIRWGLRYIRARYGTPRRAWLHSQATGWYTR